MKRVSTKPKPGTAMCRWQGARASAPRPAEVEMSLFRGYVGASYQPCHVDGYHIL